MKNHKVYYTNARMGGKVALLAGPFATAGEAGAFIDVCGPMFVVADPTALEASFGVMECNAEPFAGYGRFNLELIAGGCQNVPFPGISN